MKEKVNKTGKRMPEDDAWISQAMEAAGVGFGLWDITSGKVKISASGQALHGLASGEAMNYRDWLMSLHADDRELIHQAIRRAADEGNNYRNEYRVIHPDGAERWISIEGRGYADSTGSPSQLVTGILFDVTLLRRMEQELKEQNQTMAHMMRTATLGELSAALAHELNQPLSAILCNAQAGQRFLVQPSPNLEEVRAIFADIAMDNQRAGTVVARLRRLFRKEESVQEVLEINPLIEEVTQLLHSELVMNQVSLLLHLGDGLPRIKGDPVQIRQVLLNLVKNCIEAMTLSAPGYRRLQIRTSSPDAGGVEVVIRDTGPGIVPQMLEKIFESFITNKPGGLGMGLAISRTIINAHGGRLWADNFPEGGAILRFTLPALMETSR